MSELTKKQYQEMRMRMETRYERDEIRSIIPTPHVNCRHNDLFPPTDVKALSSRESKIVSEIIDYVYASARPPARQR